MSLFDRIFVNQMWRGHTMNFQLENIKLTIAIVVLFVVFGLVGACMWHVFELITGYTEGLFRMAGL